MNPINSTSSNRPYVLAALFACAAALTLPIDIPVARFAMTAWTLGDVRKLLDISEAFAHGFGILLILIAVAVLDPVKLRKLPRVVACTFGAGLMAQMAKHLLPRVRPHIFFEVASDALGDFVGFSSVAQTQANNLTGRAIQSFPSGHTATAVGLAFGLTWLYPRGRWLFALLAFLAAAQRVQSSAHFLSDTLAAASMASLVAGACLDQRLLGRWFARFEARSAPSPACSPDNRCPASSTDGSERARRAA